MEFQSLVELAEMFTGSKQRHVRHMTIVFSFKAGQKATCTQVRTDDIRT